MKKNPNDNYYTTTNPIVIEDGDTAEQMIFLINAKNRLVIRSLLEEDIKSFVDHYKGVTSKEKREKKRVLYENIPEKNSQNYFFCIEKINGIGDNENDDSIYGLPREPLGICIVTDEEVDLQGRRKPSELGAFLYDFNNEIANQVDDMLPIIANYLEVEETRIYFVLKQPQKVARWMPATFFRF